MMSRNIRVSRRAEQILGLLKNVEVHPTAEWIYHTLKEENNDISIATVYRSLLILEDLGKIKRVLYSGVTARYDYDVSSHYHFHCNKCDGIFNLPYRECKHLTKEVNEMGYRVEDFSVTLNGLCVKCLE